MLAALGPGACAAGQPGTGRWRTRPPHQKEQRLPTIGAAPDFALTSQDGAEVTLGDFRGKVVAVAFIYTSCPDVCPMLTDKMARVQDELGPDFGTEIAFVSITVDPERDTPEVLKGLCGGIRRRPRGLELPHRRAGGDSATWRTATAWPCARRRTARSTTPCSRRWSTGSGSMRVQYLGYRFDPEEFRHDLLDLVNEP